MSQGIINELKRRNVFKVTGGYLLMGWLVLQIADVIVPALSLPSWTITLLLVIGLLGLPFVILFSWIYEMTPEGLKLTKEVDSSQSITHKTGKKLEYVLIAVLSLSLLMVVIKPTIIPHDEHETEAATDSESVSQDETPSIAVLPFEDFSPNKDQAYFSSGISEEILNLLAKTNKLRVAARTSSFAFRGETTDIREIGEKLNVATVLEGSIRKFDNKVRITAQLINVADGYHIWSETYDRELKDVFKIQDDISAAILDSLKIHLLGESNTPIEAQPELNVEAYDKFLIANERMRRNKKQDLIDAVKLYETVLELEPDFVDAKVKLVLASLLQEYKTNDREAQDELKKANDALITHYLEPLAKERNTHYELNGVLGFYHKERYQFKLASDYLAKALTLNSNYADAYAWRADLHFESSDYELMLADREKAYQLDPMSIEISRELAYDYRSFWRPEDAQRVVNRIFALHPGHPDAYRVMASNEGAYGNYAKATLILERAVADHPDNEGFKNWLTWLYVYLDKPDKAAQLDKDWRHYEFSRRVGDNQKSIQILSEQLATDERDDWLFKAMELYLLTGQRDQLKSVVVESIENMDERNVPWRKRCYTYLIAALDFVDMNDNVQSMMDKCRQDTENRLAAGFLCPCSWYRLVQFAILDNRYRDAVKRSIEWLDNGDSNHELNVDPLFVRLEEQPEYPELLERNWQQIERQIRIYDSEKQKLAKQEDAQSD